MAAASIPKDHPAPGLSGVDDYDSGVALVVITASIQASGKTARLGLEAIKLAGEGELIDLSTLDAEALLGRRRDAGLDHALEQVALADRVVLVTPVYRATYSGLLKVFFDLLPQNALAGSVSVLVASGVAPAHFLSLDTGLRVLVASLGGWSAPTVVYATAADFEAEGGLAPAITKRLEIALAEAAQLAPLES